MRYLNFILVSLLLAYPLMAQQQEPAGYSSKTITSQFMIRNSARAETDIKEYGINPTKSTVKIFSKDHTIYSYKLSDYEKIFKQSGGPILRSVGIDFRGLMGIDNTGKQTFMNWPFLCYMAFLTLMIGFHWFGVLNNVSKGKGDLEIIPLIGKLCMGMVVCFNLPFVYAVSMTLKDVGEQVVMSLICNSSAAANSISRADVSSMITTSIRNEAIVDGAQRALGEYLLPIEEVPPPKLTDADGNPKSKEVLAAETKEIEKNSGRYRLAQLVAELNSRIHEYKANKATYKPVSERDAENGKVAEIEITELKDSEKRSLMPIVPFSVMDGPGCIVYSMEASDSAVKVDTSGNVSGSGGLAYEEAYSNKAVEAFLRYADTTAAAVELNGKYQKSLINFLTVLANTYTGADRVRTHYENNWDINPTFTLVNGGQNLDLGTYLFGINQKYKDPNNLTDTQQDNYKKEISNTVYKYFKAMLAPPGIKIQESAAAGASEDAQKEKGASWRSAFIDAANAILNFPRTLANMFLGIVKWFWVPAIAWFADTMFRVIIEFYVYLLWLAYPFWFYKKTEKAFMGALDTLVSVCFTAATFCLITFAFEGFAGQMIDWVCGAEGSARGIIQGGATTILLFTPLGGHAWSAIIGIAIGYAIFYVIGTAICLKIAPKVFKAFKEGSSVITPMIMGAASAVVAGVAAGAFAGTGGMASALGKATGSMGKGAMGAVNRVARGAVNGVSDLAEGAADRFAKTPKGQAAMRGISNFAKSPSGQRIGNMLTSTGNMVSSASSAISSGASRMKNYVKNSEPYKSAESFIKNPGEAMGKLAESGFAKTSIIALSALSGDPSNVMKTYGGFLYAKALLKKQQAAPATTEKQGEQEGDKNQAANPSHSPNTGKGA